MASTLLWQKNSLDVRQDSTLCNGHTRQQFVQLFIVAYCQLQVSRYNTSLLVVTCRIASKFQHLSSKVLHHCRHVDRSAGTNTLCIVPCNNQ